MTISSDVCVIGAGLTGTLAVKYCLEYDLSVLCYEQRSILGGLWTGTVPELPQVGDDGRPRVAVYQSLVMDISRTITSFTDFPLAETLLPNIRHQDRFLTGRQFLEYLNRFVHHFGIDRHIQLSSQVLEVKKLKNADGENMWAVTVRQKDGEKEVIRTTHHNYVIVASGFYSEPFVPEIPGIHHTPVKVFHTGHVRKVTDFENKRVVVGGGSVSAGDMAQAVVVARATKVTWAATRDLTRSLWFMKCFPFNRNATWDECFSLFSYRYHPNWLVQSSISKMVFSAYGRDSNAGMDLLRDRFSLQDPLIIDHAVRKGQLEILPTSIQRFSEEKPQVELANGIIVDADACLLGSGYRTKYPFLGSKALGSMEVSNLELHRNIVPVDPSLLGLTFLYTTGIFGGGFCPPEMEARWLVHQIANERLSSKENHQLLVSNAQWNAPIFNHGIKRPAFAIVENLACDLGCEPHFLWAAFFSPSPRRRRLGLAVAFGPWLPQLYRLRGPHAKPKEVEDIIISCARCVRGWKFDAFAITVDVAHTLVLGTALYSLLLCARRLWN